jgi:GrpB-like predicted nucleotidyltransferase (UPF0157 family)
MKPEIVARGPQILIVENDAWPEHYEAEERNINSAVGGLFLAMEHIGSTSVLGLAAKPVVDILAGTRSLEDGPAIAAKLQPLPYVQLPFLTPNRLFFLKRGTDTPEGVDLDHPGYNIHVSPIDRFYEDEEILFRDYLRAHPEVVAEYARLKCEIVGRISNYREYTPAKNEFIRRVLADARAERP